ncbi:microfibril-associated glycoprotein 4-like isoform X1 [Carassius auratus]|uniref:Microfibril-associated glycoprotein 4-like isoform X1 n=1 Tax=Carassius auratus TaxID=7957 RepID=A0A6P6J8J0_CARAU|nr:microfibril-associated glycoprotein 4-like isoform X1 [Carassius auratus]
MAMLVVLAALLSAVLMRGCTQNINMPADCSDLYKSRQTVSGIYFIYPAGDIPVSVYCEMISGGEAEDNGAWTVFQRRMDGTVNFYRPWDQYKRGFGNVEGEYWLGLENMYQLTRKNKYMLRVDLEDFQGNKAFALYSSFSVGPEADGYKLQVSGFKDGGAGDSLSFHNGQKFSTFEKDQDVSGDNCAKKHLGGFWYKDCLGTNPNGIYLWGEDDILGIIGNVWKTWKNFKVGMKSISMKIRRVS